MTINIHQSKIYSVQALRGIAALLVVGFHLGGYINENYSIKIVNSIFEFGFSGVDFFFVLSGFIISYASYSSIDRPEKIREFLLKRLFRVLPIYWIVITPLLLSIFLLPNLVNSPYSFSNSNIILTYFVLPNHPKLIIISWTLSHELYFYLLFSLLIISRKLIVVPILILLISLINWMIAPEFLSQPLLSFMFSPLNFEFLLGVIAFICYKNFSLTYLLSLFILGLSVFVFIVPYQFIMLENYQRILLFGIPSFGILLSVLSLEKLHKIKSPDYLNKIGDASYMIYLIHYPAISLLNKLGVKTGLISFIEPLSFNLLVFVSIILLSLYLFKYLEKPLLSYLNKLVTAKKGVLEKHSDFSFKDR